MDFDTPSPQPNLYIRPKLLTKNFIQKIADEQKVHVTEIKTGILSKNFYVFVGIFIFLASIFMIYRYFEKKEREEKELEYQQRKYQEKLEREEMTKQQRLIAQREIERQRRLEEESRRMDTPGSMAPPPSQMRSFGERSDGLEVEIQYPEEVEEAIGVSEFSDEENQETLLIRN
jgi:hypothetical protein